MEMVKTILTSFFQAFFSFLLILLVLLFSTGVESKFIYTDF
ncbi:hypothetical protein EDD64_11616 [Effusibacillus lacus]|nr:hypothetical protein EDD64_11616 [Effusibacillus lacus]